MHSSYQDKALLETQKLNPIFQQYLSVNLTNFFFKVRFMFEKATYIANTIKLIFFLLKNWAFEIAPRCAPILGNLTKRKIIFWKVVISITVSLMISYISI